MLKTIKKSSNKKLGGCAATYRAGQENVFSTCPSSCPLKPENATGSAQIDHTYLEALIQAVPRGGVAWTYTHFPKADIPITGPDQTCINISTDTIQEAIESFMSGHPTVVVRPATELNKVDKVNISKDNDIRIVRCPAEYSNVTCNNCGGDIPLCARHDRDYVIKFTAHGSQAKTIQIRQESPETRGGCYGNGGPVRLQWEATTRQDTNMDDSETLRQFVEALPEGTKLRHHVVGDIG